MDYRYLDRMAGLPNPRSQEHPRCVACGYDLHGSTSARCPECGTEIDEQECGRFLRELHDKVAEIDDLLQWQSFAWKLIAAGLVLQLLRWTPLLGGCANALTRVAIVVCGMGGFFIGANLLRLRGVPEWARGRLTSKPDKASSAIGLAGGPILVAAAIIF